MSAISDLRYVPRLTSDEVTPDTDLLPVWHPSGHPTDRAISLADLRTAAGVGGGNGAGGVGGSQLGQVLFNLDGGVSGSNLLMFDGESLRVNSILADGEADDVLLRIGAKGVGYMQFGPETLGLDVWAGLGLFGELVSREPSSLMSQGFYLDMYSAPDKPRGMVVTMQSYGTSGKQGAALVSGLFASGVSNNDVDTEVTQVAGAYIDSRHLGLGNVRWSAALRVNNSAYNGNARDMRGLEVAPPYLGLGGTIEDLYGLYVDDMILTGVTNSWAIRTGTGLIEFGDRIIMHGIPTDATGLPPGSVWSNAGVLSIVPGAEAARASEHAPRITIGPRSIRLT